MHSCVWYDAFMCTMRHPYVGQDTFICGTWLIDLCDMAHSTLWHDSFSCHACRKFKDWSTIGVLIPVACARKLVANRYFCCEWVVTHEFVTSTVTMLTHTYMVCVYMKLWPVWGSWSRTGFFCCKWVVTHEFVTSTVTMLMHIYVYIWSREFVTSTVTMLTHTFMACVYMKSWLVWGSWSRTGIFCCECVETQTICVATDICTWTMSYYGVATISRLLKMIGLFCKRALQKRRYSAKETYNFKEPTNYSHFIPAIHYEACGIFTCIHTCTWLPLADYSIHTPTFMSYTYTNCVLCSSSSCFCCTYDSQ